MTIIGYICDTCGLDYDYPGQCDECDVKLEVVEPWTPNVIYQAGYAHACGYHD